jgi:hypothetical protein
MCQKCSRLTRSAKLRSSTDLFDLVERLAPLVEDGALEVVQASSPLLEVRRDWPVKDKYFYALRCTRCGRDFQLMMDMGHSAGEWY